MAVGERAKTLATVTSLYEACVRRKLDRSAAIVALGLFRERLEELPHRDRDFTRKLRAAPGCGRGRVGVGPGFPCHGLERSEGPGAPTITEDVSELREALRRPVPARTRVAIAFIGVLGVRLIVEAN